MGNRQVTRGKIQAKSLPLDGQQSSLVLAGFMGTGKSSVGRIIARKLGREFVDMDVLIEAREGRSVGEIFEKQGEPYFRTRESELCAELGARENLVIATGGGALVNAENLGRFINAFVICLDASAEKIWARLNTTQNRPLLAGGDARKGVGALLTARSEAYARIAHHVDTNGKSAEEVADEALVLYQEAMA